MRRLVLVLSLALAACVVHAFAFDVTGQWKGVIVIEAKSMDSRTLQQIKAYQNAAKRTTLSLVLRPDKTFRAVVFNSNGRNMTMDGAYVQKDLKLELKATVANGIKQKDPGLITVVISKDGKTLTAVQEDPAKRTKWVYTKDIPKKNGK